MRYKTLTLAISTLIIMFILVIGGFYIWNNQFNNAIVETRQPNKNNEQPDYLYSVGNGIKNVDLKSPMGIATDKNGLFYVTDTGNHQVKVLGKNGDSVNVIGKQGKNQGEFEYPYGIVLLKNGNLLVTDSANMTIQEFTSKGKFLKYVISPKDNIKPGYMSASETGQIYVSDLLNHQILVINQKGNILKKINGSQPFKYPQGIAEFNKQLWVADSGNNQIKIIDLNGNVKKTINNENKYNSKFSMLRGIAIDNLGRFYIADTISNKVIVFNQKGNYLFSLISEDFAYPMGIYIDKSGKIYIINRESGQIQVWGYK